MFDQILDLVKEHLGNNPQAASAIPADKRDAVSHEVASHINDNIKNHAATEGAGGLLSKLQDAVGSGSTITKAIEGGLAGGLISKLGLPPAATGAIAAILPGILQKFAQKANDPNDDSISADSITNAVSGKSGGLGSLGGLFNR